MHLNLKSNREICLSINNYLQKWGGILQSPLVKYTNRKKISRSSKKDFFNLFLSKWNYIKNKKFFDSWVNNYSQLCYSLTLFAKFVHTNKKMSIKYKRALKSLINKKINILYYQIKNFFIRKTLKPVNSKLFVFQWSNIKWYYNFHDSHFKNNEIGNANIKNAFIPIEKNFYLASIYYNFFPILRSNNNFKRLNSFSNWKTNYSNALYNWAKKRIRFNLFKKKQSLNIIEAYRKTFFFRFYLFWFLIKYINRKNINILNDESFGSYPIKLEFSNRVSSQRKRKKHAKNSHKPIKKTKHASINSSLVAQPILRFSSSKSFKKISWHFRNLFAAGQFRWNKQFSFLFNKFSNESKKLNFYLTMNSQIYFLFYTMLQLWNKDNFYACLDKKSQSNFAFKFGNVSEQFTFNIAFKKCFLDKHNWKVNKSIIVFNTLNKTLENILLWVLPSKATSIKSSFNLFRYKNLWQKLNLMCGTNTLNTKYAIRQIHNSNFIESQTKAVTKPLTFNKTKDYPKFNTKMWINYCRNIYLWNLVWTLGKTNKVQHCKHLLSELFYFLCKQKLLLYWKTFKWNASKSLITNPHNNFSSNRNKQMDPQNLIEKDVTKSELTRTFFTNSTSKDLKASVSNHVTFLRNYKKALTFSQNKYWYDLNVFLLEVDSQFSLNFRNYQSFINMALSLFLFFKRWKKLPFKNDRKKINNYFEAGMLQKHKNYINSLVSTAFQEPKHLSDKQKTIYYKWWNNYQKVKKCSLNQNLFREQNEYLTRSFFFLIFKEKAKKVSLVKTTFQPSTTTTNPFLAMWPKQKNPSLLKHKIITKTFLLKEIWPKNHNQKFIRNTYFKKNYYEILCFFYDFSKELLIRNTFALINLNFFSKWQTKRMLLLSGDSKSSTSIPKNSFFWKMFLKYTLHTSIQKILEIEEITLCIYCFERILTVKQNLTFRGYFYVNSKTFNKLNVLDTKINLNSSKYKLGSLRFSFTKILKMNYLSFRSKVFFFEDYIKKFVLIYKSKLKEQKIWITKSRQKLYDEKFRQIYFTFVKLNAQKFLHVIYKNYLTKIFIYYSKNLDIKRRFKGLFNIYYSCKYTTQKVNYLDTNIYWSQKRNQTIFFFLPFINKELLHFYANQSQMFLKKTLNLDIKFARLWLFKKFINMMSHRMQTNKLHNLTLMERSVGKLSRLTKKSLNSWLATNMFKQINPNLKLNPWIWYNYSLNTALPFLLNPVVPQLNIFTHKKNFFRSTLTQSVRNPQKKLSLWKEYAKENSQIEKKFDQIIKNLKKKNMSFQKQLKLKRYARRQLLIKIKTQLNPYISYFFSDFNELSKISRWLRVFRSINRWRAKILCSDYFTLFGLNIKLATLPEEMSILDPSFINEEIGACLKSRVSYIRVLNKVKRQLDYVDQQNRKKQTEINKIVKYVRVLLSGRFNRRADRAAFRKLNLGFSKKLPRNRIDATLDYDQREWLTKQGLIGIKIWTSIH